MDRIAASLVIRGRIEAREDLTIEGRVDGPVWCEAAVTIAPDGSVTGDIVARDITVLGSVSGSMVATEIVDIREHAQVDARIVSARFSLAEGAAFAGQVQPQQLEAALRVAEHRRNDVLDPRRGDLGAAVPPL